MRKKKPGRKFHIPQPKQQEYDFTGLYREYYKPMVKQFYSHLGNHEDAEDVAQDFFEKFLKYWKNIQWDKLTGLMAIVARNVKYDHLRKIKGRPDNVEMDNELEFECHDEGISDPIRLLVRNRSVDIVSEAAAVLEGQDRDIFMDFYFNSMASEEICEKYGIKKGKFYDCTHRIRRILRKKFKGRDFAPDGSWNQ